MYEWLLFAVLEDESVVSLTPDEPFIGTFWDAGEEADRLIYDMSGVVELVYERGPRIASVPEDNHNV